MYLIFNKDMKYIGYSNKKNIIDTFLNQRKNKKFIIYNIKKNKLNKSLKKDLFDKQKELRIIDSISGIVGFDYEDSDICSFLIDLSINCKFCLDEIFKQLKYCVFNKKENEMIMSMIKSIDKKIKQTMLLDSIELFDINYIMKNCNWEIYPTYPIE